MTDGLKLDPPGPHLEHVASTIDGRLENLVRAYTGDPSPEAATIRWLATGWLGARAGLEAAREEISASGEEIDCDVLLECVVDGLEVPKETE